MEILALHCACIFGSWSGGVYNELFLNISKTTALIV